MSTFDISSLGLKKDVAEIVLTDFQGEPLKNDEGEPLTIHVYGPSTKEYQEAQHEKNQGIMDMVRNRKKGKDSETTARTIDVKFLARITAKFVGFRYKPEEEKTPFEEFLAMYSDGKMIHITEQVNKGVSDLENFI